MGGVYADITLMNKEDMMLAKRNLIDQKEVKQMTVYILVDSGAYMMAINETIQAQLQWPAIERRKAQMADDSVQEYAVAGPIEVKFSNRRSTVDAMVLPGDAEPLLGAISMEDMDVLIHRRRQELVVNPEHPYFAQLKMK